MTPEEQLREDVAGYVDDPLGFVLYAYPWGVPGTDLAKQSGPRGWQRDVLTTIGDKLKAGALLADALREAIQIAIASGHGIGKSALISMVVMWAMSTREDTKGVVTANTEGQLRTKTWPELSKWHRLCITSHWFNFAATSLHSKDSEHEKEWRIDAVPWSVNNTEAFAGLHNEGKRILLVFDEASSIDDKVWEVAQGALTDEGTEIIWLAFGNPTRNTGRFRECFGRYRHRWSQQQIDSRTVEGTNKVELGKLVDDNGEDSDIVKVRIRGMFPSMSAKQFISVVDVDAASKRHLKVDQYSFAPVILTVDPAWSGDDPLIIAKRQGLKFEILRKIPKNDNDIQIATLLAQLEDEHHADAVFIDAGYGTGIKSAGDTFGRAWTLVWFGGASNDPGCLNKRMEMWREARDWLKEGGAIPDDKELYDDLIGPETVPRVDGKMQLESKEDMKRRGLPSPNKGDALALSFAFPVFKTRAKEASRALSATRGAYDPMSRLTARR